MFNNFSPEELQLFSDRMIVVGETAIKMNSQPIVRLAEHYWAEAQNRLKKTTPAWRQAI